MLLEANSKLTIPGNKKRTQRTCNGTRVTLWVVTLCEFIVHSHFIPLPFGCGYIQYILITTVVDIGNVLGP